MPGTEILVWAVWLLSTGNRRKISHSPMTVTNLHSYWCIWLGFIRKVLLLSQLFSFGIPWFPCVPCTNLLATLVQCEHNYLTKEECVCGGGVVGWWGWCQVFIKCVAVWWCINTITDFRSFARDWRKFYIDSTENLHFRFTLHAWKRG
jgi:hypothetical protein